MRLTVHPEAGGTFLLTTASVCRTRPTGLVAPQCCSEVRGVPGSGNGANLRSEVQQGLWLVSYGAGGFILRRTSRLTFQLLLQWCAVRLTPGVTEPCDVNKSA